MSDIVYLVLGALCLILTFIFFTMVRAVRVDRQSIGGMRKYHPWQIAMSNGGLWLCAFLDIYTAIVLVSFLIR